MASPSSSRAADTRLSIRRGLLLTAGFAPAVLAAAPLHAQDANEAPPPEVTARPEPAPVPATLDELIPAEAVADPEGWATRGAPQAPEGSDVSRESSAEAGSNPSQGEVIAGSSAFLPAPPPSLQDAIDAAFADFALELPEPLTPDPEVETLAAIAMPVTGELPELARGQGVTLQRFRDGGHVSE